VAANQPTTAEWTILGGAAATFLGSFLDAAGGANAWGSGSFSVIKLVPIYAIFVGGVVALRRFLHADLSDHVGPFTWPQLLVVVSKFGTLMAAAWIIVIEDREAGLWVMTIGSLVMTIGAVADRHASTRSLHLYNAPASGREELSKANLVILVGAAAMILGSFLAFWKLNVPTPFAGLADADGRLLDTSFNAWNRDYFFPVTIIPVLCGAVMAIGVVLRAGLHYSKPSRLGGYTWDQIQLACGGHAAVMMVAFAIGDRVGFQLGIGFYLMLAASIVLVVGAAMRGRERYSAY
jgi:hypothetical protein